MSKYASMAKGKLSEGKEKASGLKGRAKGKVTGIIPGRGKPEEESPTHVARPLNSLRDPNSFAPPPRRTAAAMAPPPPPAPKVKRSVVMAPSKYEDPHASKFDPPPTHLLEGPEDEEEPEPVSQGYRVNATGLATDHLPPPPGRRDGANIRAPPSYESAMGGTKALPAPAPKRAGAPSLPPRLPPRHGSGSPERAHNSPLSTLGASNDDLNQGAISRLGAAGVSVPAFGIGSSKPAVADEPGPPKPPRPTNQQPSQLNELQNRFSRLGTSTTGSSTASATPPTEGTTWAQKQAALKTASSFQKNPSSVSLTDAKSALGTANNFRQRHGDQVAAGVKSANSLNQKYGVANKVAGLTGSSQSEPVSTGQSPVAAAAVTGLAGKKKPPPPPPKKKPSLAGELATSSRPPSRPHATPAEGGAPPPIPMSTRPTF